ncbi:MAG: DnaA regulatory inactivator Hda [Gammaproteobacteria bacterium]
MTDAPVQPGQIPLPFRQYDHYELEQYWAGDNREALEHLLGVRVGSGGSTCLWGESGTGKSHLLQAMCTRIAGQGGRSAYLPLGEHAALEPGMLQGLEQLHLVCMDDVHAVAGSDRWERAVFNLFNGLVEAGNTLVFSASVSPRGLPLDLPDLKSRLQSGLIFHLTPLPETARLGVLRQRARRRGFDLSDEVTAYIARRLARDTHSLFRFLDRLDEASLAAKRKLTVPFVRELLDKGEE